jgi:hypothetical protein
MSWFTFVPRADRRPRRASVLAGVAVLVASGVTAVVFAGSSSANPAVLTGYQVLVGSPVAVADNGGTNSVTISCPSGKSALSAGVSSHSPMMFINTIAPVNSTDWFIQVTQTGNLGYTEHFTPYIVCANTSSVPGLHFNADPYPGITAAPNAQTIKDAFCDSSTEYVVGGGFDAGLNGTYGSISYPIDNRTWQVGVDNTTGASHSFTTFAVCLPQADVAAYQQLSGTYQSFGAYLNQPVPGGPGTAGSNTAGSGYCPTGTLASGGGVFNHDGDSDGFIVSSLPSTDFRYWLETSTDLNPPSYGEWAAATVICLTASVTIDTTTTVTLSPPSPGLNQSTVVTATVTPQSGSGTPTGTVTFYDNGTPIGSATLSGGSASITTTFGGGSHSITAHYGGDSTFNPSTSLPVTFTIACTTTISGTHGPITATSGLTCVNNAVINGAIVVVNGSLDIENSTVRGAVSVSNGTGVRICGSSTDSVTVSNATGFVRVGDPANNCPANTIAGSVVASSNHGGGTIVGNTLTGSVITTNDTPAFTVSGNHH